MNIDFSLVLVVLCLVSGGLWLFDALVLAKPRNAKVQAFLKERGLQTAEFSQYIDALDETGQPVVAKMAAVAAAQDPVKLRHLQTAAGMSRYSLLVDYGRSFFPILLAVTILRSFLFEPFKIPSGSMIPTLNIGDFIVVNKYAYGLRLPITGTKIVNIGEPKRGDVMVFVPPHNPDYYIKRVIGLPGDHVQFKDNVVYLNGEAQPQQEVAVIREIGQKHLRETINGVTHDIYNSAAQRFSPLYDNLPAEGRTLLPGEYFMMGDNRDNSADSRFWGPALESKIVGKAVAVWMHKEPGFKLPTFSQNRLIENAK
jgi:signal peptidase I